MTKQKLIFLLCFFGIHLQVFTQQIAVPRIELMPDKPVPYAMRHWKQVATDYNRFVFDESKTGQYLPLVQIKSPGNNYPGISQIIMDTYVGSKTHGSQAEAINIMPAVVGSALVGIDQTNNFGRNWVPLVKDFFNLKNGQNVYLNGYSAASGGDWWYDMMPNVYFYQLYHLYPDADPDFAGQFTTVADRWLDAVYKLGGVVHPWAVPNMNYRAFNLATGKPLTTGVKEPEAAGGIAWLLYHAYQQTGDVKYIEGAQLSLDFLQTWTDNPSYELQLPYGTLIAAKMNAIEGTNYDVSKLLNWCFNRGALRGWGVDAGQWGGYDISGLVGEANDNGNDYAFIMNGFQQTAALVPLVKYDKRFARAIGKWMVNIANASRLMYWNALPEANQEPQSYAWASQNDPDACIPYESMKQNWSGKSPYAMGDAVGGGWASTNLSLYSGSSVGYMASIISTTDVEGILQLDLNITDFFDQSSYPTYLYYNPLTSETTVSLTLPADNYDIYDAITEIVIATNVSGTTGIAIPADGVRLLAVYPTGNTMQTTGRIKTVNGKVIDYHSGYNFDPVFRIKAFTANASQVEKNSNATFNCLVDNIPESTTVTYNWSVNGTAVTGNDQPDFLWQVPAQTGNYTIKVEVTAGTDYDAASLAIEVVDEIVQPPVINSINISSPDPVETSSTITLSAIVDNPLKITAYRWSVDQGTLSGASGTTPSWTLPSAEGIYTVTLEVDNSYGTTSKTREVLVRTHTGDNLMPLIYYPFNGNTNNAASASYNAVLYGAMQTSDAKGSNNSAYRFTTSSDIIYTPNDATLNFTGAVTISFWLKPDQLPNREQFVVSHGSWEERYKASIINEKKLRWTVKTDKATVDVDCPLILQTGEFYHFAVLYTGFSMEIYCNGILQSFKKQTGAIAKTSKNITLSRKDNETTEYSFRGTIDEVRIYDKALAPDVILTLPDSWNLDEVTSVTTPYKIDVQIYPNPTSNFLRIQIPENGTYLAELFNSVGQKIQVYQIQGGKENDIAVYDLSKGLYFIRISLSKGGVVYSGKFVR